MQIEVKQVGQNFKYQLQEQAWTAVNVFSLNYVVSQSFQLPLLEGAPSLEVLHKLRQYPAKEVLRDMAFEKKVRFLDGASVFVRIADGRREEELEPMVNSVNIYYLETSKYNSNCLIKNENLKLYIVKQNYWQQNYPGLCKSD